MNPYGPEALERLKRGHGPHDRYEVDPVEVDYPQPQACLWLSEYPREHRQEEPVPLLILTLYNDGTFEADEIERVTASRLAVWSAVLERAQAFIKRAKVRPRL